MIEPFRFDELVALMDGHPPPCLLTDRRQALQYGRVLQARMLGYYERKRALSARLVAGVAPDEIADIFQELARENVKRTRRSRGKS